MKSLLIASLTIFSVSLYAQPIEHGPDWPYWAYGQLAPFSSSDRVAPPCPDDATPLGCAYSGSQTEEDGIKLTLPDSDQTFTAAEADFDYGPGDWYPGDHPPMPDVVAHGKQEEELRSCSLCHYANGQGKMENGHVAGLPVDYFIQQLEIFERGERHSADIRKANTNEMAKIAAGLSADEKRLIAEYFGSIEYKQMVRVVETEQVPQVRASLNGLLLPLTDLPMEPIGQRIIEVPEQPERTEVHRDPRSGFIAYVPPGSLAKGEELVTTGGGKTIQCGLCHGPEQKGLGIIPPIAGRTTSYIMRQLWDVKQGTRISPVMVPIVANLTAEDMLNITAYIASLEP